LVINSLLQNHALEKALPVDAFFGFALSSK